MNRENILLKNVLNVLNGSQKKKCSKCKKERPLSKFRIRHSKKKDGTIKYYHYGCCKKCEGKYIAKWMLNKYQDRKNNHPEEHKKHLLKTSVHKRQGWNNQIDDLSDRYMAMVMQWDIKDIKKYPELVEAKRAQLRLKRKASPNFYQKNRKSKQ